MAKPQRRPLAKTKHVPCPACYRPMSTPAELLAGYCMSCSASGAASFHRQMVRK